MVELIEIVEKAIQQFGSLEAVAHTCGLRPSSLYKVLDKRPLSRVTYEKLNSGLSQLSFPLIGLNPNTFPSLSKKGIEKEMIESINQLIQKEVTLDAAAAVLGVRPSTIRKALNGVPLSSITRAKMMQLPTQLRPRLSAEKARLISIFEMYKSEGTLEKVGSKLNITRERVRQLLVRGQQLGIFNYKIVRNPVIPIEKILQDIKELANFNSVAKNNGVSPNYLRTLMKRYKIRPGAFRSSAIEKRKSKCIEEFNLMAAFLHKLPTTTEMQTSDKGRSLYNRISRYWGSIDNFRDELKIPKPPQGNPKFKETMMPFIAHRQKMAMIVRSHHLDSIKESLEDRPLTLLQIARKVSFKPGRVYRLLTILLSLGAIKKDGIRRGAKYSLIQ